MKSDEIINDLNTVKSCANCQWRGLIFPTCYRAGSPNFWEPVQDDDCCGCWETDEKTPDRKPDTRKEANP